MRTARFTLDPAFTVGEVNPRLFGSFVEHLGRCVYTGIFEPGHPAADEAGLRTDVLELVRELGVTAIRYPGGNFVSGYKWEDSVGPAEERPRRLDLAWRSTESNRFGLSEYIAFLKKVGPQAEPMMAVNLGTRGVAEALELQEYANHPAGTALSGPADRARRQGPVRHQAVVPGQRDGRPLADRPQDGRGVRPARRRDRPRDAPDRPGRRTGRLRLLRPVHGRRSPRGRRRSCGDVRPRRLHLAARLLRGARTATGDSFLASAVDMESFIENVVATCDHVGARLKSKKKINLSFDEWNVWYMSRGTRPENSGAQDWPEAPRLLEDVYSVTDAVVFGSLLIALLRHADRVTVACLAQLVNVIAPIMTEPGGPAWRQTTFFPFAQASRYGRGEVLDVRVDSPTYETKKYGEADLLHATAVRAEDGSVTVFAVNRSQTEPLPLEVALNGLELTSVVEHSALADADPDARNTLDDPERVAPHPVEGTTLQDGTLTRRPGAAVLERDPARLAVRMCSGRGSPPPSPALLRPRSPAASAAPHPDPRVWSRRTGRPGPVCWRHVCAGCRSAGRRCAGGRRR